MRIFDCLLASITALLVFSSAALANGYETYPAPLAWSPDGQQIAALISPAWPYDDGLLEGALLMFDQNGRDPRLIADFCVCGSPAFSPDGKSLAYIASDTLMLIDLAEFAAHPVRPAGPADDDTEEPQGDGGWASWSWANAVTLIPGLPLDVCWAPPQYEGSGPTLLVTAGNRFYGCDIYRVDPLVYTSQRLTFAGPDNSALCGLLSPDAARLWFLGQNGLNSGPEDAAYERLFCLNTPGSQPAAQPFQQTKSQQRPEDYHESNAVLCGPDSLLFQRGGWGDWQIWRFDLKSGNEYLEVADAQQPSLSADGRWLVYARRAAEAKAAAEYDWEVLPQVWLRDRESGLEQQISDCPGGAEFPAITADGSRIAWLESVEGETRVHTALREALTAAPVN